MKPLTIEKSFYEAYEDKVAQYGLKKELMCWVRNELYKIYPISKAPLFRLRRYRPFWIDKDYARQWWNNANKRHTSFQVNWPDEGRKSDQGKPRLGLIPPVALIRMGECLAYGAEKYGEGEVEANWRKVANGRARYLDATLRHLVAYMDGEEIDPESGITHIGHALCNLAFIAGLDDEGP